MQLSAHLLNVLKLLEGELPDVATCLDGSRDLGIVPTLCGWSGRNFVFAKNSLNACAAWPILTCILWKKSNQFV